MFFLILFGFVCYVFYAAGVLQLTRFCEERRVPEWIAYLLFFASLWNFISCMMVVYYIQILFLQAELRLSSYLNVIK